MTLFRRSRVMDLGNPWLLVSGILIGLIGMWFLRMGKREANLRWIAAGLGMCVYPYFVSSLVILWLIAAGMIGGLYLWSRYVPAS